MRWPYRARYRSPAEREVLRQEVYRAARRRGVQVVTRTDGRELVAVPRIAGRCLSWDEYQRRRTYRRARDADEAADLRAVREMRAIIRAALRGGAEG